MRRELSNLLHTRLRDSYYRLAFGRRLPFRGNLDAYVQRWERQAKKGDVPQPADAWDDQYTAGKWSFMGQLPEAPRYGVVIAYLLLCKPGGSVLDVGCGEGILFRRFRPYGYSRYLGVDISHAAVDRLSAHQDAATTFVCADAESYTPPDTFDAIVFNEVLYYFGDPFAALARYYEFLREEGIIVVSTYLPSRRAVAILERAKSRFAVLDEVRVGRAAQASTVTVLTKRDAGSGTRHG